MSDWFDPKNESAEPKEEPTPASSAPETPVAPDAQHTVPPEQPAPTQASWTAPSNNGCTYHYANPYRQQDPNGGQTPPSPSGWQQNNYGSWNVQQMPPRPPRKKPNSMAVWLGVVSVICVLALSVCGVMMVQMMRGYPSNPDSSTPTSSTSDGEGTDEVSQSVNENAPSLTIDDREDLDGGLTNTEIVKKNVDSTVLIDIFTYVSGGSQGGFNNWGDYGSNNGQRLEKSGCATGIIWTADGYIITNSHCVADETSGETYPRIDVTLYNGTVYEDAKIIGYDPTSDLAVIKVEATDLQPATFGDSTLLQMGDRVAAIGNPGGLGFTSTFGTISGLNRDVYDDAGYGIKCLQTDAVINPGNSGGPLINAFGQVIAINSAKIVAQGYEGLGFSIPINEAKPILDDLVKYGYVTGRVSLGITGYSVTTVGLEGFQIASIEAGSALEGTDAKVGDIISYVDDVRVTDYSTLRAQLAAHKVGDTVKLGLMRYDSRTHNIVNIDITCVLGENRG